MTQENVQEVRIAINPRYLDKIEKIRKLKLEYTNKDGTPNKKRVVESALDVYYNFLLKIADREQKIFINYRNNK